MAWTLVCMGEVWHGPENNARDFVDNMKRCCILMEMILGELIYAWQAVNRKSLRKLARTIGCDHTTLHRFVHGKQVEGKTTEKIIRWALSPTDK